MTATWPDGKPAVGLGRMPEWLWVLPGATAQHVRMYAVLDSFPDRKKDPDSCHPSYEKIAARYGLTGERAAGNARRIVDAMEALNIVKVTRRRDAKGRQISSLYTLARGAPFDVEAGAHEMSTGDAHRRSRDERGPAHDVTRAGAHEMSDVSLISYHSPNHHEHIEPVALDAATELQLRAVAEAFALKGREEGDPMTTTEADYWLHDLLEIARQFSSEEIERVCRWLLAGGDPVAKRWRPRITDPSELRDNWATMRKEWLDSVGRPIVTAAPDPSPVQLVFEAWREATGKRKAKLDANGRGLIERALKSHELDDVLDAVRGWRHSPYHRGENDRGPNGEGKAYNELSLLLRNAEKIEQFRDLERSSRANGADRGEEVNRYGVAAWQMGGVWS
jgi:hypothetical protein